MRNRSEPKRRGKHRHRSTPTLEHVVGGFDEGGFVTPDTSFTEAPNFESVPLASDASFETFDATSAPDNDTVPRAMEEIPTLDPEPAIPTLDPAPATPYTGPFRDGDFIHNPRSLTPEQAQGLQDLIDSPRMQPWMADEMRHFLQDYRDGVDRIFPEHPNPFPGPIPRISDPDGNVG